MAGQKFYASPTDTFTWPNGAVGHRPGGSMDCLGPFAKVRNCPIIVDGAEVARLTCYATNYADTFFSMPAVTQRKGKRVVGYFTSADLGAGEGCVFHVMDRCKPLFDDIRGPVWRVVVGNCGEVYSGRHESDARESFAEYCDVVAAKYGRLSGEPVTLFCGEVVEDFRESRHDAELTIAEDRAEDRRIDDML